ncbi:hypothetical protein BUALT_Bualt09G0036800 [Buddleja alternifolia]|uniref:protein-serine/threonine phosphatase n=1 Tax=Buddleja alternifolia TaxID=168488 RepID=A0AAV6WZR7_9LAMI|nr:hypothetical protein BUALT_Bualt09G0036800 [Buddleja alternifolia]
MHEISQLLSLPYLISNHLVFTSCADIVGIELIPNTENFLSEQPMTKLPLVPFTLENRNPSSSVPQKGVIEKIESNYDKSDHGEANLFRETESCLIFHNSTIDQELKEEDESNGNNKERKINKLSLRLNVPPLWGLISICGRRAEMEDSVTALPRFLTIPSHMLSNSPHPHFSSLDQDLTAHVFGVYDGHGGFQVAKYCRDRLHVVLAEEIGIAKEKLYIETGQCNYEEEWMKIFLNCFRKLDDEVGGFDSRDIDSNSPLQPIAPESVGSTAVVAIVSSTHIIVANCGDSRAVLCRGKIPVPLSIDHKPNREDECARIEGVGGMVINWDGHRVSGVLAVSRSIGDRYLRPYVVADPEVTIVPRAKEDKCLILASDGLWDVMTNDEACDFARRRVLLWHKKNGGGVSRERGMEVDPAAQDAADYLSEVAFKRGSTDNISVIVIDLKAQRKFKNKT